MADNTPSALDELIRKRRSIRKYKMELPLESDMERMLRAACYAPSPSNSQPVRFIEICSRPCKKQLEQEMGRKKEALLTAAEQCERPKRVKNIINTYYRYSEWMFSAPILLAAGVVKESSGFSGKLFEAGLLKAHESRDSEVSLGLALKGFILKAEDLGLGTCILTAPLVFAPDIAHILGVDDVEIRCLITVGYPDETPAPIVRKAVNEIYRKV